MSRLRENIWYAPGRPVGRWPLVCRSVSRFAGKYGESSGDTAKPYWHLHWIASGLLGMSTPDTRQQIAAGEAIVVSPGLKRRFDVLEPVSGHALSVIGAAAESIFEALGGSGLRRPGPPPVGDFMHLEQEIRRMTDDGGREASVTAYRILMRACFPGGASDSGGGDSRVCRAIRLMDAHFHDPEVNVQWLARQLGCHRSFLARRFREQTGQSPSEYLIGRRLQQAMNALRGSDGSVTRIAEACGFGSVEYFSRLFRRRIGIPPTVFRREQEVSRDVH